MKFQDTGCNHKEFTSDLGRYIKYIGLVWMWHTTAWCQCQIHELSLLIKNNTLGFNLWTMQSKGFVDEFNIIFAPTGVFWRRAWAGDIIDTASLSQVFNQSFYIVKFQLKQSLISILHF